MSDDRPAGLARASTPDEPVGLTRTTGLRAEEVARRVARGQTNVGAERTGRTVGEILRANLLTRFNFLLGSLLAAILVVGPVQDALFGIVLVANALIGIVQELRAKRTLDRLVVLTTPSVSVVRDGVDEHVAVSAVVLDDLVVARAGDQIVSDGIVRLSSGLQVDESLLTGEAEPVEKGVGDRVLSGSFVAAGAGRYQATAVGPDAYARRLTADARRFTPTRSELMDGINRVLRYLTWVLVPVGVLLLVSQWHVQRGLRGAISGTVAGLVGMVPQGLVLLTSVAFAAATLTLARRHVMIQELPAIEVLARVDVVCFDKTGTLTDGSVVVDRVEVISPTWPVEAALAALSCDEAPNATLRAIAQRFASAPDWTRDASVPFSSTRKWSAASFADHGTWVLGAPEMVLPSGEVATLRRADELAATGQRVLVLARADARLTDNSLPDGVRAAALVLLNERVRDDAAATLAYFAAEGVATKVISGDHPLTVAAIAARVGLGDAGPALDARDLPEDPDALGPILERSSVFGRVTPRQKQAMVTALQARGHTVAMTGDGVNDVLALKLADIGIAMGTGAPATRAVAQVVLIDDRFATLPDVVAAGRRVSANIERVANVYLVKTVWATLLAVLVSVLVWPYPFLPRHLTVIDSLTIGIPTFFLALAPNRRRFAPGFVGRVTRFALPLGLVVGVSVFAAYALARARNLPLVEQRTGATLVALTLSLGALILIAVPLTWRRLLLVGGVSAGFVALFPLGAVRSFYALELPSPILGATFVIAAAGTVLMALTWVVHERHRPTRTPTTPVSGVGGRHLDAAPREPGPSPP